MGVEAAEGCGVTGGLDYRVDVGVGVGETQGTSWSALGRDPVSWLGVGGRTVTSEDPESCVLPEPGAGVTGEERGTAHPRVGLAG